MFGVTILGNNSAVPAYNRHPTCQIVTIQNELYMIDCGEGAQMQIMKYKIKRSRLEAIFISHLHGDHYFGLIGLITSFGLIGRKQNLTIYAPGNLAQIIQLQLDAADIILPYNLTIIQINEAGILLQNSKIKISCFATNHRITCYGFRFEEVKNPRKIDIEKALALEIPSAYYAALQQGDDYTTKQGTVIYNSQVTTATTPPKVYAYCADTKYDEAILPYLLNANLLYHETTYLHNLEAKAIERFHSTSKQAASIALQANAKQLLIGHFSSKYENLDTFITEATEVFTHTSIAVEGATFYVS